MSRLLRPRALAVLWCAGFVAATAAVAIVWLSNSIALRGVSVLALVIVLVAAPMSLWRRFRFGLKTLTGVIAAMRGGDYTTRVRDAEQDDALGAIGFELNELADSLHQNRLRELEATALLKTVVGGIDAAVFAFDGAERLRLVNPAGATLLGADPQDLHGRHTSEIEGGALTSGPTVRTFRGEAKWQLRRSSFRDEGRSHQLVVAIDLSRALRDEERLAWQKILRVITHELNNSVAPIRSLTTSARALLQRQELPDDWRSDLSKALEVIGTRTEALARFTQSYAQLTRLPEPSLAPLSVRRLVEQVVTLEQAIPISIASSVDAVIAGDAAQLEQLLINLVRNAAEAMEEKSGLITISWLRTEDEIQIFVVDEGCGVDGTTNLFVPFFTTKPSGSGVGLVLSRQIAEAHGGSLTLTSRTDGKGARATLSLPADGPLPTNQ